LVAKHNKCNKNEVGKVWWQNQSILVGFQGSQVWWWCECIRPAWVAKSWNVNLKVF